MSVAGVLGPEIVIGDGFDQRDIAHLMPARNCRGRPGGVGIDLNAQATYGLSCRVACRRYP